MGLWWEVAMHRPLRGRPAFIAIDMVHYIKYYIENYDLYDVYSYCVSYVLIVQDCLRQSADPYCYWFDMIYKILYRKL